MRTLADTMKGIMPGSISHQEYKPYAGALWPVFHISWYCGVWHGVYQCRWLRLYRRTYVKLWKLALICTSTIGAMVLAMGGGCSSSNIADSRSTTPQWYRPGEAVAPRGSRKDSHIYRASTYWLKRGTSCSSFILEGNTLRSIPFSPLPSAPLTLP